MKKFLVLFLVFATLISLLAACAETPQEQPVDTVVEDESTEPAHLDSIPEDLKFNGEDIVILNRALMGWTWDEVAVPEQNSDPVNDAMFNRNITVTDRLNVNIVSSPIDDPNENVPIDTIKRVVKSGSDEFDLVAAAVYVTTPAALEGTFYNLAQLQYLDLINALFIEVNPIPIKEAMNLRGMDVGGYRLPLCEISDSGRETVRRALEVLA